MACTNILTYEDDNICLVDIATTHTILRKKKYFTTMKILEASVNTISGFADLTEGFEITNITLYGGTKLHIENALHSSKPKRNLLSFKDIRKNDHHMETGNENSKDFIYIMKIISNQNVIVERFLVYKLGIYFTRIKCIESYATIHNENPKSKSYTIWHERLGHPGSNMMCRIIKSTFGHPLKIENIEKLEDSKCVACSEEKFITRLSIPKVDVESLNFLQRIQGDIC